MMTASAAVHLGLESPQLRQRVVEPQPAEFGRRQVTIGCVPRLVALQEQHLVPESSQPAQQRATGGGVAVAL
jgi:hypothetical protein